MPTEDWIFQLSTIFFNVDLYMDRAVHISWNVDVAGARGGGGAGRRRRQRRRSNNSHFWPDPYRPSGPEPDFPFGDNPSLRCLWDHIIRQPYPARSAQGLGLHWDSWGVPWNDVPETLGQFKMTPYGSYETIFQTEVGPQHPGLGKI